MMRMEREREMITTHTQTHKHVQQSVTGLSSDVSNAAFEY